jgi:hypothetical protein
MLCLLIDLPQETMDELMVVQHLCVRVHFRVVQGQVYLYDQVVQDQVYLYDQVVLVQYQLVALDQLVEEVEALEVLLQQVRVLVLDRFHAMRAKYFQVLFEQVEINDDIEDFVEDLLNDQYVLKDLLIQYDL